MKGDIKEESRVPFLSDDWSESDLDGAGAGEWSSRRWVVVFGVYLASMVATGTIASVLTNRSWSRSMDKTCALHTSRSWSPVMQDVDIKYSTVKFNGSFFKDTIYRQPPSPEVDAAWKDLGIDYAGIIVPPSIAEQSNIQSNRVLFNETFGGPGYPGIFEVFHQLHCLDVVRKSTYFNYEYYLRQAKGPFKHPEQLRSHVGHCIDTIRQQLMCTADTGIHPFVLVGDPPIVFPDFEREHQCKNFADIRAWAKKHQGNFDETARFHTPLESELILAEVP